MDDGMDGWMEKASQRPLLYVMFLLCTFGSNNNNILQLGK
jgi:hypothetical protein